MIQHSKMLFFFSIILITSTTSFGMREFTCTSAGTINPYQDLPILIAASGDGEVKNKIGQTCKKHNQFIRKTNPVFVSMSAFTAHQKDIHDIALFFSWNNDAQVLDIISEKMNSPEIVIGRKAGLWASSGYSISWPNTFKIESPKNLRAIYVENDEPIILDPNQLPCDAEIALLFAALCKDEKAVKCIAAKIRALHGSFPYYVKVELHRDLLERLMVYGDTKAFALVVKNDPYNALNFYRPQDKDGDYHKPFLNQLIDCVYIEPKKDRETYIQIYRDCGGKTREQLEAEKPIKPYSITAKLAGGFLLVTSSLLALYKMGYLSDEISQLLSNILGKLFIK